MSEADRVGYEARLLQFFPNDTGAERDAVGPGLPDWLLTGAWITVPPDRAERLPPEARSFVNEFVPTRSDDEPLRERMVARDHDGDASEITPPHGDKLR